MTSYTQRQPFRDLSTSQPHVNPQHAFLHKRISALKSQDSASSQQVRGSQVLLARSPMQGRTPVDVRRASKKAGVRADSVVPFRGSELNVHCDFDHADVRVPRSTPSCCDVAPIGTEDRVPQDPSTSGTQSAAKMASESETATPAPATSTAKVTVLPFAPPPQAPRLVPLAPPTFVPPFEQTGTEAQQANSSSSAAHLGARFLLLGSCSTANETKENACANTISRKAGPVVLTAEQEAERAARLAKKEEARKKRQEALERRAEQERLKAEEAARKQQERNDMILKAISTVDDEVELDHVAALRELKWEMAAVVQALSVLERKQKLAAFDPDHVEAAICGADTTHLGHATLLQDLHWRLMQLARGAASGREKSSALWRHALREWARDELDAGSPFLAAKDGTETAKDATRRVGFEGVSGDASDDDDEEEEAEELEYEELTAAQRLSLLHDLAAAALGASIARDTDAADLRPSALGRDSRDRVYWLVEAGSGRSPWLLREHAGAARSKTRESLLSGGGTPSRCSADASMQRLSLDDTASVASLSSEPTARSSSASPASRLSDASAVSTEQRRSVGASDDEGEAEEALERGEAGENYLLHLRWTAAASRASRPAAAPRDEVELVAADGQRLAVATKGLFASADARDQELAAQLAPLVLQARAVVQQRRAYGTRAASRASSTRPMRA